MSRGDEDSVQGRQELPDRRRPAHAGLPEQNDEQAPGTGFFGDETLVKPADGVKRPGIAREIPEIADE